MIQIYNPDNTEFDYNGDMILQPEEATVHVILGSTWEAEITHPIDDEGRWAYIVENAVVKMPSFNGEQLWRIVSTEKTDSGISAAMQPIFYDAANEVFLVDVRPADKSGQEALDILMEDTKYSGESDIETPHTAYYEYKNLLEALNGDIDQSFVNRWGGEIIYDNFKVIINTEAGEDNGVEIRYGKNIPENGFAVTEDMSEVVTRIYPKGYDGVTMTDDGYVDSDHIDDYPTVRAATITYDYIYYTADMDEDEIAELEEDDSNVLCSTQDELDEALTEACEAEFNGGIDVPAVTIECDMVLLQNTKQYKDVEVLEEVSLGDTIYIVNSHIGFETTARVIELEYDSILQRIVSVVIGDFEYDYFSESAKTASELSSSVNSLTASVGEFKTVIAEELYAVYANIETLTAEYAEIEELKTTVATIETAYINAAYVAELLANYASISYLEANYITASTIKSTYATIDTLESTTASIKDIFASYVTTDYLTTNYLTAEDISTTYLSAEEITTNYLTATEIKADYVTTTNFYALTGTVEDLTTTYLTVTGDSTFEGDVTINGLLSAVYASIGTVSADYISANTGVITNIISEYINASTGEFDTVISNYISANKADIEEIVSNYITTAYLEATEIEADTITVGDIFASYVTTDYLEANYLTAEDISTDYLSASYITANYLTATEIAADYASLSSLNAVSATISSLSSTYADITFSNVSVSNVVTEFVSDLLTAQGFLATSATVGTISVTSYLTGVGIIADYITAGTLDCTSITVANLSVGVLTVDSLNGYTLAGRTVDAEDLQDLLEQIMDAVSTTDEEVAQALEEAGLVTTEVSTLSATVITDIEIQYYLSTSSESTEGGSWSSSAPEWTEGTYVWTRNLITYGNGSTVYSDAVCVTGNSGSSGSDGVSVTSIVNYYARSTSSTEFELSYSDTSAVADSAIVGSALTDTIAYDGWSTEVPEINETYRYLWNFEIIYYSDGSYITTDPHVVGVYGATGSDGKGISSITEYYGLSTDSDTQPDSWSTDVPTLTSANKYLWNYEVVTYTDSTTESTTPLIIGVYGDTGEAGVGISEVIEYYASSSSNSAQPTSWSTTVTSISSTNKYLWNYEKVVYTDGTSVSTTPAVIGVYGDTGASGSDGADGSDGVGISSIVEYYGLSASTSTQPSEWLTSPPVLTSTNKYLWNYETVVYTDGTTSSTEPAIIGVYGDTGASGSDGADGSSGSDGVGVKSITNYYLLSTSNTDYESEYSSFTALADYAVVGSAEADCTDWSTAVPTMTAEYKYLWCYTVIEYTDGSTSVCEPYVLGTYGDTGADGADGTSFAWNLFEGTSDSWQDVSLGAYYAAVFYINIADLDISEGDYLTVSGYLKGASSKQICPRVQFYTDDNTRISLYDYDHLITEGESTYFSYTWAVTEEQLTYTKLQFCVHNNSQTTITDTTTEYCKAIKLEYGETASAWAPAYTELAGAVEEVQEQLEEVVSIANGKTTTYFADTAPSSSDFDLQENDVWFDTDDDNAMYMYDGSAWEKCEYGTDALSAECITAELIAAKAVTTAKIAAGAVTANEIAANTITGDNIKASSITSSEIDTDSIATAVLSATYIQASTLSIGLDDDDNVVITNGMITADMIDAETITGDMIVSKTITATQIAAGTITATEIDTNSVKTAILTAGSIYSTLIDAGAVTAEKISISDLSALSATIGGFTIGTTAIYSDSDTYEGANNVYLGMNGISLGETFSVDSTGNLAATQGTIGAITLSSTGLYSCNVYTTSGVVGTGTADYAVTDTVTADNYAGIYKPSTISSSSIAFFAGATSAAGASATFSVTYGGTLTATDAVIEGEITATSGTIGGWNIASGKLYATATAGVAVVQAPSDDTNFCFAAGGSSHSSYADCPFRVTKAGKMYAEDAEIAGTITATSGTIGGFTIGSSSIYTSSNSFADTSANIYIGSSGISLSTTFSVTQAGYLTATSGLIGAFYLGSTALYTSSSSFGTVSNNIYIGTSGISLSTTFKVTAAGAITATSGTIGAITLSSTGLYAYNSSYSGSYAGIYRPSTITTGAYAFFAGATSAAGASAGFYVTYGGTMYASNAEISGTITTESGYYKSMLTSGNLYFYYDSTLMGTYGSTAWADDSTVRGVRFGMEYYCDFMSFSRKTSADANTYSMYMYFDWSGDISGYEDSLIINSNAYFTYSPHFVTNAYVHNGKAIYFYTSGDSTPGGYLYMNSNDNISLTCLSGNLYVFSAGGALTMYSSAGAVYLYSSYGDTYVYSTAGNALLYSTSGYTRIGYSGLATYIYGNVSNNLKFANTYGIALYNSSSSAGAYLLMNSSNNVCLYSSSYPVYVYGNDTYLGYPNTDTTIRGAVAFTGTVDMASACTFANGYGVRGTDTSGNVYYICDISSENYCYLGTSSLPTYVRGSSIALNATVTHTYGAYFNNGYGLGFYDSDGSAYGYLIMDSTDVLNLNGNGYAVWVRSSGGTYIGYSGYDTYIYGYIESNLNTTNGHGLCFYDTDSTWAGACYMNSSNYIVMYSTSYPVYIYGSTTYLGNSNYATNVNGSTVYINGSAYSSDISVKNTITNMDDSYLDLIDRLTPRSFYYNWNSENLCNGFIAQEVMEALEEVGITNDALIRYNEGEGTYALDYNGFIPILVAAAKELRSEVAALQTELSALQSA